MKKKVLIPLIVIAVILLVFAAYYLSPKTFCKNVDAANVDHINVFDGNTGVGFTIDDPEQIQYIVENIQSHSMRRSGISLGYTGYSLKISLIDSNDRDVVPVFIINSDDTIRKDPFFYSCDGGLCYQYIKDLEYEYSGGYLTGSVHFPEEESMVTEESLYMAIVIDEVIYINTGIAAETEPDEVDIEYVEIPVGGGSIITSFSRNADEDTVVCCLDGEWIAFQNEEVIGALG